ncbi:aspartate 1-decarboxylase [Clostridiaceae bacterium]|nr:aspartate 1-decarboxylase [Clostridium sp.]NBI71499.1 aspartate 1-decarboxylase [Clostridiaceae bacterium]
MNITMLKGKIHRATVSEARLDYVGSITVDETLMEAAEIREYEQVQIVDIDNGQRFETYVIAGEKDSGLICLNGAAARMVQVGDKIIIMSYAGMTPGEADGHAPKVVFVDGENRIARVTSYERHGRLADMEETAC